MAFNQVNTAAKYAGDYCTYCIGIHDKLNSKLLIHA